MKYSTINPPKQCYMRQSTWYKNTTVTTVKGVLWHSTGANNPEIRRYVQPDDNASDRDYWISALGTNIYKNDWNHITNQAGVHAFIGKLANGEVTTVQVGEWGKRAWGCGAGARGSCNSGWIQFEICEDNLTNKDYFNKVYREGVELTAYLCKLYNLNPNGQVQFQGINVPVILCHHDSYKLGLGSGHVDVDHWFEKFGKTMQNVRDDVAALLAGKDPWNKEESTVDLKEFTELMKQYRTTLQDNDQSNWSKKAANFCIDNGLIAGAGLDKNGNPNYMFEDFITREQAMQLMYNFAKWLGKA